MNDVLYEYPPDEDGLPRDEVPFCIEHQLEMNLVDYDDGSRYECPECQRERGKALGLR